MRARTVIPMPHDAYIQLAPLSALQDVADELLLTGQLLDGIVRDPGPWEARQLVEQAASEVYELAGQLEAVRARLDRG